MTPISFYPGHRPGAPGVLLPGAPGDLLQRDPAPPDPGEAAGLQRGRQGGSARAKD